MIFDMPSCGGCRTCEMACSFRHREEFIPSLSSIKILDKSEGPGFRLLLLEETGGDGIACHGCKNLEEPLCVQYCPKSKDLIEILNLFTDREKIPSTKKRFVQTSDGGTW